MESKVLCYKKMIVIMKCVKRCIYGIYFTMSPYANISSAI